MAVSQEEILDAIANMTVLEVVGLVEAMEKKFGVSAASVAAIAAAPGAAAPSAAPVQEEQTEFNVHMTSFGANKVAVIKAIRTITSLGLKEAKDLVESVPTMIKEAVSKEEAEQVKKLVEEAGGTVEIK